MILAVALGCTISWGGILGRVLFIAIFSLPPDLSVYLDFIRLFCVYFVRMVCNVALAYILFKALNYWKKKRGDIISPVI